MGYWCWREGTGERGERESVRTVGSDGPVGGGMAEVGVVQEEVGIGGEGVKSGWY